MHRTPRSSDAGPQADSDTRRDRPDREREATPEHDRLQDAAGRDAESGRNGGRESDDTRQST